MSSPKPTASVSPPRVGIVILHWNNYPATERCLRSLAGLSYPAATIYLVDNGSTDGSMERLEREFAGGRIVFMRNGENLGFAAGNNPGIARALADGCAYVMLLNNDCIAAGPDLLEGAVSLAQSDPRCGVVGGKVLEWPATERIWHIGGETGWIDETYFGVGEIDRGQHDQVMERGFISGALMLIKREVFERVGLLPDVYFFGFEDREFALSVQRAGYRMLYYPGMVVYHEMGGSHVKANTMFLYNDTLSRVLFKRRTLPRWSFLLWVACFRLYLWFLFPLRAALQRSRFQRGVAPERLRAIMLEALADAPGVERVTASTLATYRARHPDPASS